MLASDLKNREINISEILSDGIEVDIETTIIDTIEIIMRGKDVTCLIVLEGLKPKGIVEKEKLDEIPAIVMLLNKPISRVMSRKIFLAEHNESVLTVFERAKSCEIGERGDIVIVQKNGKYLGYVKFSRLIDKANDIKIYKNKKNRLF